MTFGNPKQWAKWLPLAEWWYNTNHYSSLKCTLFQALYGFPAPQVPVGSLPISTTTEVGSFIAQRQLLLQQLKDNLGQAQARMKFYADQNRSDRVLEVEDLVYLKLQHYRQSSVTVCRNLKLSEKYYGPYKILQCVGAVAYRVELPTGSRIHPVFLVSQLKHRVGQSIVPQQLPLSCGSDGTILVQPAAILQRRMVKVNNAVSVKVLVQWENLGVDEATWEDWGMCGVNFRSLWHD
ncbi:uncharacterized protein LOC132031665 [Lycium ferocissimum]|uniref:uncharacterized protein LOC132031665 n=1 Tax=Lycium ferocissimum TaxID=112874 RepID=UPI002815A8FB|nr:uncharacterized protein LOC132031665 [Lycium ferocissimum]